MKMSGAVHDFTHFELDLRTSRGDVSLCCVCVQRQEHWSLGRSRGLAKWPGAGSWEFQIVNSEITKVLVEEGGPGLIFPHHRG